jgi:PAS domain S-box-containing protein
MSAARRWQFESQKKWSATMLVTSGMRSTKPVHSPTTNPSDDFLQAIVDACVSGVAVLDENGSVLYASKAWHDLTHVAETDGDDAHQSFSTWTRVSDSGSDTETHVTLADDIQRILSGAEKEFHARYCQPSTNQRSSFIHGAQLNLPGSTFRVLISYEDIGRSSEDRLAQLLDSTKIMAWEGSTNGERFTYVSEHAVKILGYPVTDWYEPNFLAAHIHADDLQWVLETYRKQSRTPKQFDITFRMLASDGRVVWIQNLASVEQGMRASMYGFMIDVSERKRAEKSLQDLGGRLIAAQEEERKRVARELHDDLNQRLALLSIELQQLSDQIDGDSVSTRLLEIQSRVQEISTDIHRLSYRLHPAKLDHLGLAAAVKSLCNEISQSGKLRVDFIERELPADLPKDITLCVFRIAQELLRNCVRHSGAQLAQVYLRNNGNTISLTVMDDGHGFNTKSDLMEKGLGFISIKERLHVVGGQSKILSQPRRGTCVNVTVPLNRELLSGSRHATDPKPSKALLSSVKAKTRAGSVEALQMKP